MYCDYDALNECTNYLNNNFKKIESSFDSFQNDIENILSADNWSSPTKDYLMEMYSTLKENFNNISLKCNNIVQYLNMVANNYKTADEKIANVF